MATITAPPVRNPVRPVRVLISGALRSAIGRIPLRPGDPSPCCAGDRLFVDPHRPGWLVCPARGEHYPARAR